MEGLWVEDIDSMLTYVKSVAIPNFSSRNQMHGQKLCRLKRRNKLSRRRTHLSLNNMNIKQDEEEG